MLKLPINKNLKFINSIQTGSKVHIAFYPMAIEGSFLRVI
jgi:hypothetical protein